MNKNLIASVTMSAFITTGCAFFDVPVDDLAAPGAVPAIPGQSTEPSATQASEPALPAQIPAKVATAAAAGSYLIVAPIEDIPENAGNVTVVHFTRDDTDRALALCKALTANLQILEVQDLPASPTTVAMWPVANDNAGASCIEMLTDYTPIDISENAAKRVNNSVEGPFLLTQQMATGKRMIYDMSFVSQAAIRSAVGEWQSLMGSDPDNWPAYRRAR